MKQKKSSLLGSILVGIILIIAGTILLWWNEGNNVKNIKTITEVSKKVIEVDSSTINPENNGKLISTNGDLIVEDKKVYDNIFGIGTKSAKVKRVVEVYQWEEEKSTDSNNNTTYKYNKKWNEELIDSDFFNNKLYKNPEKLAYETESFIASKVKLGEYSLSSEQINSLPANIEVDISNVVTSNNGYKVVGNYITNADDYNSPEIGDIRISWKYNGWNKATVLAVQDNNTFLSYTSEVGKKVNEVNEGILTSSEMIKIMQNNNNTLKWVLRLLGTILIFIGYLAFISPITKLASFIPVLGNIIGSTIALIAFLVSLTQSVLVIAIAWIRFRPILGICMLVISGLLITQIIRVTKKNKQ